MAAKNHIFVLTTRDIYNDGGEKSLMMSKDKYLKRNGYELFYYSFRRVFVKSSDSESDRFILKKDNTYTLFYKRRYIKENINDIIKKNNIRIVVLSGAWLYLLKKELLEIVHQYKVKISLDYQGTLKEIKEYNGVLNSRILSNLLYRFLQKQENEIIDSVTDGIEVVSPNALEHLATLNQKSLLLKSVVVSCGISRPISYEAWAKLRKIWRNKFDLSQEDISVVYAGGVSRWQNIDEVINFAQSETEIAGLWVTSKSNQNYIKSNYSISDNITFGFLSNTVLLEAMTAFDYGILIRDKNDTNYVAFPNKYSEYINARLTVLLKNEHIGCYPSSKEEQQFIKFTNNIKFSVDNKKKELYDDYILKLSYNTMIKRLIKYYDNL